MTNSINLNELNENIVLNLKKIEDTKHFLTYTGPIISDKTEQDIADRFGDTFGLGDVLFFLAVSFSFSTISFVILFICALIFSLVTPGFKKEDCYYCSSSRVYEFIF